MDKKSIIAIVAVSILIIFYWPILQFFGLVEAPKPPVPTVTADSTAVVAADSVGSSTAPITSNLVETPKDTALAATITDTVPVIADTITVETNKYTILLSSKGGAPISIKLKEYSYRNKQPIEILANATSPTPVARFAGSSFSTANLGFTCNLQHGTHSATGSDLRVEYVYQSSKGGTITQSYVFHPDKYDFDYAVSIDGREKLGFERQYNVYWPTPLGVTEPSAEHDYAAFEAVTLMSNSRERLADFKDDKLDQTMSGLAAWAALRSQYFAVAIIPSRTDSADGVFAKGSRSKVEMNGARFERRDLTVGLDMPLSPSTAMTDSFTIYAGPLDYTTMSHYDVDLEAILDIGTTPFIGWIIKPFALGIIWLLPRMHIVFPNYGIVIILFAILMKIITLPLSLKSYKSMNAVKVIQPKVDELKKKYKNNPQQLNAETMKLYKAHGVNPLSGCLPILPQMPLFFALFAVFRSTILLRDAPFFWFINDLSRGASSFTDPYMILVVLMIGSQFLSSFLTMSANPQNKMLVYLMPLLMGFIFYKFAAGLVLYWTVFSLLSILDYYLFRRTKNTDVQTVGA